MISIKNKFWMLVYAYKLLDLELIKTSSEKFTNVYDLLLHELNYFLERQIKKGLICSYQEMTEDLYSVKGRINISESFKNKMQLNNKLVCDYDEF